MSERKKQTAFLKTMICYADTSQCRELQERIARAEHDEKSIRRAMFLAITFGIFSLCGLGYCAVFLPEFFRDSSLWLPKLFRILGLGSVIGFVGFLGYLVWHRRIMENLNDECRHSITDQLESRFGDESGRIIRLPAPCESARVYQIVTPVTVSDSRLIQLPKAS